MSNWREPGRAHTKAYPHNMPGACSPTLIGRARHPDAGAPPTLRRYAPAIGPRLEESSLPSAPHAHRMRPLLPILTAVGIVGPPDLYVVNWYIGGPVHAVLNDIVTRYLISFSFVLAIFALPVLLIVTALHIRQGKIARAWVATPTEEKGDHRYA